MSITKAKRDKIRDALLDIDMWSEDPEKAIDAILKKHLSPGLKTSSAKGKGRKAQQLLQTFVQDVLVSGDPMIDDLDEHVRSTPMGMSGEDLLLSPTARHHFPFAPECKNTEKIGFWPVVTQAESNAGNYIPLIFMLKNRTRPWVAIPADTFFELLNMAADLLWRATDQTLKDNLIHGNEPIQEDQT
jgi:hypothetical protein